MTVLMNVVNFHQLELLIGCVFESK